MKRGGKMFEISGSKNSNSSIDEIIKEFNLENFSQYPNATITGQDESENYKKFFADSIYHFKLIIRKMIMMTHLKSHEKLKNLILLQTLYSIKVLNVNPESSFINLDPKTMMYYETTYNSLKKFYFDILEECKQQKYLKLTVDNELIFTTIQDMILHRYLFYYKTGEISEMIDYIDETFDILLKDEDKNSNK